MSLPEEFRAIKLPPTDVTNTRSERDSLFNNIKVYVINLDRRTDRWAHAYKILTNAGFKNITRISAIDGKQIDSEQIKKLVLPDAYEKLCQPRSEHEELGSLGSIGCYLSHYKAWQLILSSHEPSIVVEDDIDIQPNWFKNSQVDMSHLSFYDLILLGHSMLRENKPSGTGVKDFKGMFFGTHFYYITPKGANFFLSKALPMKIQVDSYMGQKIINQPHFHSAVHMPSLANQMAAGTDIQTPMNGQISVVITPNIMSHSNIMSNSNVNNNNNNVTNNSDNSVLYVKIAGMILVGILLLFCMFQLCRILMV